MKKVTVHTERSFGDAFYVATVDGKRVASAYTWKKLNQRLVARGYERV